MPLRHFLFKYCWFIELYDYTSQCFFINFWNEFEDIFVSLDKTFSLAFAQGHLLGDQSYRFFSLTKEIVVVFIFDVEENKLFDRTLEPVGMRNVLHIKSFCH